MFFVRKPRSSCHSLDDRVSRSCVHPENRWSSMLQSRLRNKTGYVASSNVFLRNTSECVTPNRRDGPLSILLKSGSTNKRPPTENRSIPLCLFILPSDNVSYTFRSGMHRIYSNTAAVVISLLINLNRTKMSHFPFMNAPSSSHLTRP